MAAVFDFASLLLGALVVGALFAVCLIFSPAGWMRRPT
jgi:hypothetical protein